MFATCPLSGLMASFGVWNPALCWFPPGRIRNRWLSALPEKGLRGQHEGLAGKFRAEGWAEHFTFSPHFELGDAAQRLRWCNRFEQSWGADGLHYFTNVRRNGFCFNYGL